LVKLDNEEFSIPALKLLISCMYIGIKNENKFNNLNKKIKNNNIKKNLRFCGTIRKNRTLQWNCTG